MKCAPKFFFFLFLNGLICERKYFLLFFFFGFAIGISKIQDILNLHFKNSGYWQFIQDISFFWFKFWQIGKWAPIKI